MPDKTVQRSAHDDSASNDDVVVLTTLLKLRDFQYVDVAVAAAHSRVLQRWPLLDELARQHDTVGECQIHTVSTS